MVLSMDCPCIAVAKGSHVVPFWGLVMLFGKGA